MNAQYRHRATPRSTILILVLATLAVAQPHIAPAQTTGTPGGGGGGSNQPRPARTPSRNDQFSSPVFVTGRLLTDLNRPADDPITLELSCGMRTVQVIHTDLGGYFTFTVGGTTSTFQSNMDFSASNEGPQPLQQ